MPSRTGFKQYATPARRSQVPTTSRVLHCQGFNDLLYYARMGWTYAQDLASAEDIKSYWEEAAPTWEVSRLPQLDSSGLVSVP